MTYSRLTASNTVDGAVQVQESEVPNYAQTVLNEVRAVPCSAVHLALFEVASGSTARGCGGSDGEDGGNEGGGELHCGGCAVLFCFDCALMKEAEAAG